MGKGRSDPPRSSSGADFIIEEPSGDSPGVPEAAVAISLAAPDRAPADFAALVRRGDRVALDQLVRQQAPRVERLLRRILGPRADMEDLVQNVFFETCRSLPRFRGDSSVSTFVGGITVMVARRAMRPTAFWRRRGEMPEQPETQEPAPDVNAAKREQLRRVQRALEKLKPKKRIAFVLWALEGMDVEAIAEMTGASVSATRSRIFYAQKELRALAASDPHLRSLVGEEK